MSSSWRRISPSPDCCASIFAERPGETIPRHELVSGDTEVGERTIDVQINRLRRKIERDPANPVWLQTVRGVGYRLSVE